MTTPRLLVVIPARAQSHRLFCKPLQLIGAGDCIEPLVCAVVRNVMNMEIHGVEIVVAVDSGDVWQAVTDFIGGGVGVRVVRTDPLHECGTARVAEVARLPEYQDTVDAVVNVQVDQPFLPREAVTGAVECVIGRADVTMLGDKQRRFIEHDYEVGTAVVPLTQEALVNEHRVKVVLDEWRLGRCLAFYRLAAWAGEGLLQEHILAEHIGVYAYRPEALQRWAGLAQTPLEQALGLEQVRALEAGISIGAAWLVGPAPQAIDTEADLERASALMLAETTDSNSSEREFTYGEA